MLKLRYMYQIPAAVEIRAPHSHERVDWDIQGWWSFYEFAFEAGFFLNCIPFEVASCFYVCLTLGVFCRH